MNEKQVRNINDRRRRYERKAELIKLRGGKCSQCGYDNLAALNLVDETGKILGGPLEGIKWERLEQKALNCTVWCRNCRKVRGPAPYKYLIARAGALLSDPI